jgi:transketolase
MGDGEQQKGQLSEARRFAAKYNLDNLIAIVDYNQLQISVPSTMSCPKISAKTGNPTAGK